MHGLSSNAPCRDSNKMPTAPDAAMFALPYLSAVGSVESSV
jgi:hypothetical protein